MKYCPKCQAEYQDQIVECSDCQEKLVNEAPAKRRDGMKDKNIPKGISVIAIGGPIFGFFLMAGGLGASFGVTGVLPSLLCLAAYFSFGISLIISGTFLMKLREWARRLLVFQSFLIASYGLWAIIRAFVFSLLGDFLLFSLMFLLPSLWCIYYLTRPKVKEQFE